MLKRILILESRMDFSELQQLLEGGWVKDPDVPYNPYGVDNVKIIELVRYEEGEGPKSEMTPNKYIGIGQTLKVPWPEAKTMEDLDEAAKALMNVLFEKGWEMLEHYSKEALMVHRTPVEGIPVAKPVATFVRASGEPVKTVPLKPEIPLKDIEQPTQPEEPPLEEEETPEEELVEEKPPIEIDRDYLGCNTCDNDPKCTEENRIMMMRQLYEFPALPQCPLYNQSLEEE